MRRAIIYTFLFLMLQSDFTAARKRRPSNNQEEIGDVFDMLREMFLNSDGSVSPLSEIFKSWWNKMDAHSRRVDVNNQELYIGYDDFIKGEYMDINKESLWKMWEDLNSQTRAVVLRSLKSVLIGGDRGNWKLHCADAYKMCQADTNCYVKMWNFEKSCFEDEEQDIQLHSYGRHVEVLPYELKRVRRHEEERKMRKGKRRNNRRKKKRRQHRNEVWMGKNVITSRDEEVQDSLKYFSMKTRSNKCSSKCVDALIMLNSSIYGSLLASCDCRISTLPITFKNSSSRNIFLTKGFMRETSHDESNMWIEDTCHIHQHIAQLCRPRKFRSLGASIGCMEARRKCERDKKCKISQETFLSKCSEAINGARCSLACEQSALELAQVSRFEHCVCDGIEGPTCRQIRTNVNRLCNQEVAPMKMLQVGAQNNTEIFNKNLNNNTHIDQMSKVQKNKNYKNSASSYIRPNIFILFNFNILCFGYFIFATTHQCQ